MGCATPGRESWRSRGRARLQASKSSSVSSAASALGLMRRRSKPLPSATGSSSVPRLSWKAKRASQGGDVDAAGAVEAVSRRNASRRSPPSLRHNPAPRPRQRSRPLFRQPNLGSQPGEEGVGTGAEEARARLSRHTCRPRQRRRQGRGGGGTAAHQQSLPRSSRRPNSDSRHRRLVQGRRAVGIAVAGSRKSIWAGAGFKCEAKDPSSRPARPIPPPAAYDVPLPCLPHPRRAVGTTRCGLILPSSMVQNSHK